jgi:TerC family integral membrane protein
MALQQEREIQPERQPVLRLLRRFLPLTEHYEGGKFFVKRAGRVLATPLFVVLVIVETTDLVFAVDSIPAILAITTDPFIVYTSNVFAILGLRALYFALAGLVRLLHYLHYGLAAILGFVGVKMLLADIYKMPIGIALSVVAGILFLSVVASLVRLRQVSRRPAPAADPPVGHSRAATAGRVPLAPEHGESATQGDCGEGRDDLHDHRRQGVFPGEAGDGTG